MKSPFSVTLNLNNESGVWAGATSWPFHPSVEATNRSLSFHLTDVTLRRRTLTREQPVQCLYHSTATSWCSPSDKDVMWLLKLWTTSFLFSRFLLLPFIFLYSWPPISPASNPSLLLQDAFSHAYSPTCLTIADGLFLYAFFFLSPSFFTPYPPLLLCLAHLRLTPPTQLQPPRSIMQSIANAMRMLPEETQWHMKRLYLETCTHLRAITHLYLYFPFN